MYPDYPDKCKGSLSAETMSKYADRYFTENRNYEDDVKQYFVALKDCAPLTQRNRLSTIRTMLAENGHELPSTFWKRLSRRIIGNRPLTQDRIPTNAELRQIIMNMPIGGRALFLCLASSGMRIGEAMSLRMENVDLTKTPVKVSIPAKITKRQTARFTYISNEAKDLLNEWLKARDDYIKLASMKNFSNGFKHGDKIFTFGIQVASIYWSNALRKCKLNQVDPTTERLILHPHSLRKYFITKGSEINAQATEELVGHEGYLTRSYRRMTEEQLIEFYIKLEPNLNIFSNLEEMKKMKAEESKLQTIMNSLVAENQEFKRKFSETDRLLGEVLLSLEQLKSQPDFTR
jgi:integrase